MSAAHDPGLQRERTALAWSRTFFSLVLIGLLLVRGGVKAQDGVLLAAGGIVALAAGGLFVAALLRRRTLGHASSRAALWPARASTALVLGAAAAAVYALL